MFAFHNSVSLSQAAFRFGGFAGTLTVFTLSAERLKRFFRNLSTGRLFFFFPFIFCPAVLVIAGGCCTRRRHFACIEERGFRSTVLSAFFWGRKTTPRTATSVNIKPFVLLILLFTSLLKPPSFPGGSHVERRSYTRLCSRQAVIHTRDVPFSTSRQRPRAKFNK